MRDRNLLIRTSNPGGRNWVRDAFLKQEEDVASYALNLPGPFPKNTDPEYIEDLRLPKSGRE